MDTGAMTAEVTSAQLIVASVYLGVVIMGLLINAAFAMIVYRDPSPWLRGIDRLEWRPWNNQHAAVVIGGVIGIAIVFGAAAHGLFGLISSTEAEDSPLFGIASGIIIQLAMIVLIVWFTLRRGTSLSSAFDRKDHSAQKKLGRGLICFFAVMPAVVIANLLAQQLLSELNIEAPQQEIFDQLSGGMSPWVLIGGFILAAVGAPISEELIFRGVALPIAAKHFGTVPAIFAVSVVFAAIHFNVSSSIPLFVLAIGLSLAYIYTQSIIVPIVMHASFNAFNLCIFYYLQQDVVPEMGLCLP